MKTSEVSQLLGIPYWRLGYLIAAGKIPAPRKDASGDRVWDDKDIRAAKEILEVRDQRRAEKVKA